MSIRMPNLVHSDIISYVALFVSVVSLTASVRSCRLSEQSMKKHLTPRLSCILDGVPSPIPRCLFTLKNEGPLPASIVSIDHQTLRYNKKDRKLQASVADGAGYPLYSDVGKRWLFADVLRPNETIHKDTCYSVDPDATTWLNVLQFSVQYYRDTDGQEFHKQCLYFVQGGTIMSEEDFKAHSEYRVVMNEISRYTRSHQMNWPPTFNKE